MSLYWTGVILTLFAVGLTNDRLCAEAHENGMGIGSACTSMVPSHGTLGQLTPPPFSITFSPDTYTAGAPISVTIKACTSTAFKGFLIQARRATKTSDQDEALGSFTPVAGTQVTCQGKALIHTDNTDKTSLTFNWNPPSGTLEHVQFRVTFVHIQLKFWLSVKSAVLADSRLGAPVSSLMTPATTLVSECLDSSLPDGHFAKDADCDESTNCHSDCGQNGCTFQVKFRQDGGFGEFSIKTQAVGTSDMYAAVGFSSDQKMGRDSASGCIYRSGSTEPFNAFNTERRPPEMLGTTGTTVISSSYTNGIFSCTFKRPIAVGFDGKRYDLSLSWYQLFARGQYTTRFEYHVDKQASSQRYSLTGSSQPGVALPEPTDPTDPTVVDFFAKDADCDESTNCHSDCGQNGCTFQVKFRKDGDFGEFSIKTKAVGTSDMYAAVGFSSDQTMGRDSVSGCIYRSGSTEPFNAFNTERLPPEMLGTTGTTVISSSYANGIFSCTFKRPIAVGFDGKRYDLSFSWYQLFARGQYNSGLQYHSDKQPSSQRYSLTGTGQPGVALPKDPDPPASGAVVLSPECGTSKGCVSECSGSSCDMVISWEDDSADTDYALYTISSVVSSPSYLAIGFSSDEEMGGDSVSGCATGSDNSVKIFNGVNGDQKPPSQFDDPDVTLKSSSLNDNVLTCTIRRLKTASANGKRFDVTKKWYILFARGSSSIAGQTVTINYHEKKIISSGKFSSDDRPNAGAKDIDYPYVKAHGSLMIAAWVFLASIGIVTARYYKPVWKVDLCSQKVWFQIHRTCMILVFCCTAAGFVLIFLEVEGWSDLIEEHAYLETHPILGVIVTALTVLNPVMALFRPHPGTENRYIFNWAHWFVGTAAHILGVITIFFGIQLRKAQAPEYMIYILAGYAGWQVLITFILEVMQCYGRELARQEIYEVDDLNAKDQQTFKETNKTSTIKRIILLVHIFVLGAVSSILIGFICIGEDELEH